MELGNIDAIRDFMKQVSASIKSIRDLEGLQQTNLDANCQNQADSNEASDPSGSAFDYY